MTAGVPSEAAIRAVDHHTEQLWGITRGLIDAYRIDVGDPEAPALPAFDALSEAQKLIFGMWIGPVVARTSTIMAAVVEAETP